MSNNEIVGIAARRSASILIRLLLCSQIYMHHVNGFSRRYIDVPLFALFKVANRADNRERKKRDLHNNNLYRTSVGY